jgi:hypothetical protein
MQSPAGGSPENAPVNSKFMAAAKNEAEIKQRIRETEDQLTTIEKALAREMSRPFFKRRITVCHFLDLEKKLFSAKLEELKWVIYEQ